jgi:hypothetical protein
MAELKNQPPATPVAAATRPPPESTDAQKDEALTAVRLQRWVGKLRKPEEFNPKEPEQTVAVMVNNGTYGGYRAIGRYFPNGPTMDVRVTQDELDELKTEPQDLIHVITPEELSSLQGKGSSVSSAPALTADEQRVLSDFRSSGQDAATYLAPAPPTGTEPSASASLSEPSSKASRR